MMSEGGTAGTIKNSIHDPNFPSPGFQEGDGSNAVLGARIRLSDATSLNAYGTTAVDTNTTLYAVAARHIVGDGLYFFQNGVQEDYQATALNRGSVGAIVHHVNIGDSNTYDPPLSLFWGRALTDDEIQELSLRPWQVFKRNNRRIYFSISSGPQIGTVNQAIETDTAHSLGRQKSKAVGLSTETDSAHSLGRLKSKAVGQATETDSAHPITAVRSAVVGLATETDSAHALGRAKTKEIGLATETDTALPISAQSGDIVPIGLATETDTALPVGRAKVKLLGIATETDTALPLVTGEEEQPSVGRGTPRRRRIIRPEELEPIRVDGFFLQPWQEARGTVEVSDAVDAFIEQAYSGILNGSAETGDEALGMFEQEASEVLADMRTVPLQKDQPAFVPVFPPARIAGRFEQPPHELEATVEVG
jgi:hypothetical protein